MTRAFTKARMPRRINRRNHCAGALWPQRFPFEKQSYFVHLYNEAARDAKIFPEVIWEKSKTMLLRARRSHQLDVTVTIIALRVVATSGAVLMPLGYHDHYATAPCLALTASSGETVPACMALYLGGLLRGTTWHYGPAKSGTWPTN